MICQVCNEEFKPIRSNARICSLNCHHKKLSDKRKKEKKESLRIAQSKFIWNKFETKEDINVSISLHELGYPSIIRQTLKSGLTIRGIETHRVPLKVKRIDGQVFVRMINTYTLRDVRECLFTIQKKYYETMNTQHQQNMKPFIELFNRMEKYIKDNK